MTSFDALGLSPALNQALGDMGFTVPTPIQAAAIPVMMQGGDLIGQAQTGTGKTAAFAIPIIEMVDTTNRQIQAVVVCPTRELAVQVSEEFRKLAKHKDNFSVVSIYGGQPMEQQMMALQSQPLVIVGTPGRMLDHLWRGTFDLGATKIVVLDEADEMLDMGFREDIERIFDFIPAPRQTVLFSATMPKAILELTEKYQNNPERVQIVPEAQEVALIDEKYVTTSSKHKFTALKGLIDAHQLKLALVFCNTKRGVDQLYDQLKGAGYKVAALHGGMPQPKRDRVMNDFRRGRIHILVATDVAARGIDVRNVQAVVNFDLPESAETYRHRIGRTGRAGNSGQAFTFISSSLRELLPMGPDGELEDNRILFEMQAAQAGNAKRRRRGGPSGHSGAGPSGGHKHHSHPHVHPPGKHGPNPQPGTTSASAKRRRRRRRPAESQAAV